MLVENQLKSSDYHTIFDSCHLSLSAFRHIKVFVTYANDSKQHSHQVLSLCNCLDRNGFSCCVDVYSQRESNPEEKQASRDWCTRKFREVFLCLSS